MHLLGSCLRSISRNINFKRYPTSRIRRSCALLKKKQRSAVIPSCKPEVLLLRNWTKRMLNHISSMHWEQNSWRISRQKRNSMVCSLSVRLDVAICRLLLQRTKSSMMYSLPVPFEKWMILMN